MISLTEAERIELEKRRRSQALPARDVRNAEVILLLAAGKSYSQVVQDVGCSPTTVGLWKKRFEAEGLAGLFTRHRGKEPPKRTAQLEARILNWTRKPPPDGSTHETAELPTPSSTANFTARRLADGLTTFFVYLLENLVLDGEFGHQAFKPAIFLFQRSQPPGLGHVHPAVFALPGVVGRFADVVLRTDGFDGAGALGFFQDPDDLLFTESTSFHLVLLWLG